MRRCGIIILLFLITFTATWMAGAAPTPVANTKHNLSTSGTGTIKSTGAGTSEICVFCHTPHSALTGSDASLRPLWNRNMSTALYTVYTSDVLSQLGGGTYPAAESPATGAHVKTRICLSCHDGTIALGSLVNMPSGVSTIPMQGTGADYKMPQTAAGYVGIDLRDDHPVAIKYVSGSGPGQDPELRGLITGNKIWLYDSTAVKTQNTTGTGYVECTSCHNAHDNQYGNFLVDANSQSGICASCHNKTGFTLSIHDVSSLSYSPPNGTGSGVLGSTVGEVKCMDCHFPHKAGVTATAPTTPNPGMGMYLLSFQEEGSCFNNPNDRWGTAGSAGVCHGSTATGINASKRNVESETGKTYAHHVKNYTNIHKATEGKNYNPNGWLGSTPWHVECQDCHNPHTAGGVLHSIGLNTISAVSATLSPLYGAGGARMSSWPLAWTAPLSTNFTYIEPLGAVNNVSTVADKEYEVCFKCHSSFAWGAGAPPTSPSLGAAMTDQAKEFNPGNASFHPVGGTNANTAGTYTGGWNSGTQTMYCSDCHTRNGGISPLGPHGSNEKFILSYAYTDSTGAKTDPVQPSTDLCFTCHDVSTYLSGLETPAGTGTGFRNGAYNLHTRHKSLATSSASSLYAYRCVNCHTRIPHGYKNKAMIVLGTDGADVTTYAAGGSAKISSATLPASPPYGANETDNCQTGGGAPGTGCHQ